MRYVVCLCAALLISVDNTINHLSQLVESKLSIICYHRHTCELHRVTCVPS